MKIEDIEKTIRSCRRCELGKQEKRVPGFGSKNAKIFIIGESPGRREIEQGRPFAGPTSEIIERIRTELENQELWLSNVLKCPTPNFRNPYNGEISACESHLKNEIRVLNPKIILAMGRVPAFFITRNRQTVANLRSKLHYYMSIPSVITFHPSAVKRFPFVEAFFVEDLYYAKKILGDINAVTSVLDKILEIST